ncbi:MAG: adaptor protein MecA [Lachnospiraceae bacterium]|nr:adaptor protein MecA [Lachnospiraceae bacterium]
MKFEKINDNQIRCTLNKADLADRELLINELAYGTEKAKALFREMMQQASYEVGFEAEDIPLMIEAIPVSPDCLVLIITKVEDPEELDTRFSKFTKPSILDIDDDSEEGSTEEDDEDITTVYDQYDDETLEPAENSNGDALDFFSPISNALKRAREAAQLSKEKEQEDLSIQKIFLFQDMKSILMLAPQLNSVYREENWLYRDPENKQYYLLLTKGTLSTEDFNKLCSLMSEYAQKVPYTYASTAYFKEHYDTLIEGNAIQILSEL